MEHKLPWAVNLYNECPCCTIILGHFVRRPGSLHMLHISKYGKALQHIACI
ncbi:hypothetical protein H634G_11725 [Metarhizium anisopliae BRIP 53293]|uniref:Uncharacterized protein n=1 Tax=Metarhizium anisopliae BRIP 53293 TaxID=1291518 RepID=A0A0D9NGZ1_METAN|nr:hypothetical protein H634G_11725 [Metarhizium anisopliae BRIP 53293]